MRSDPSWGILFALCLFLATAAVLLADGINWSITTIYLQGRISVQLNSLLFAKTLVKKDMASGGEKKDVEENAKDSEKDNDDEDEDEDEGFSSKSQIVVGYLL